MLITLHLEALEEQAAGEQAVTVSNQELMVVAQLALQERAEAAEPAGGPNGVRTPVEPAVVASVSCAGAIKEKGDTDKDVV